MTAVIEVAAQVGGRDADAKFLPHFRALKAAAQGLTIASFPFKKLGIIFRVDGEVRSYGLSGAGNVVIARRKGESVSVDIGLGRDNLSGPSFGKLSTTIRQTIMSSVDALKKERDPRLSGVDFAELEKCLGMLCSEYEAKLSLEHANHG